jgi:hypothetical protein
MKQVTFEIEGIEYEIPQKITIEKYVKTYKIKDIFSDDYLAAKLLNILTGAPVEKLLDANFQIVQQLSSYAMLLFPQGEPFFEDKFELNGVWYGFIPSWKELSFAEWVDLDTLMSKKPEEILDYIHILTSIMYRPIEGDHTTNKFKIEKYDVEKMKVRSELFQKELDIKYFIGAQFFFIKFAKKYLETTPQSLTTIQKMKFIWKYRKLIKTQLLKNDSDGMLSSTDLLTMTLQNTKKSLKRTWWKF